MTNVKKKTIHLQFTSTWGQVFNYVYLLLLLCIWYTVCVCICVYVYFQVNPPHPSIIQGAGLGRAPRCGCQCKQQQQQRSAVVEPRTAHYVPLPHSHPPGQSRGDEPHTGTGEKHRHILRDKTSELNSHTHTHTHTRIHTKRGSEYILTCLFFNFIALWPLKCKLSRLLHLATGSLADRHRVRGAVSRALRPPAWCRKTSIAIFWWSVFFFVLFCVFFFLDHVATAQHQVATAVVLKVTRAF